ncbi:MAG TPA: glutathione S-transferase N-terminal domain-containing protein [Dongiaceae bacterium]|nr:glutathione S-transferase N-terminal domain-containing protein [Dongiaceae bacterium]
MIDLYTWGTPNGHKIHIMLAETGLPAKIHPVDIGAGEQFKPDFLKISPNNKIPALVDSDGPGGKPIAIFESGAILIYLAEKSGQFLPKDPHDRHIALQWLMFQVGHIGPMFGQCYHFRSSAPERITYAIDRYTNEVGRLAGVLEKRLQEAPFLAGEYSIADIATWPWVKGLNNFGFDFADFPAILRWKKEVYARPAVQKGLKFLEQI